MCHPIYSVSSFQIIGPYILNVQFADGVARTIDFYPILRGEVFGPLRNPAMFNSVRIDPEVHTLVWPNGADFDPATLHDWPEIGEDMVAMAGGWTGEGNDSRDKAS